VELRLGTEDLSLSRVRRGSPRIRRCVDDSRVQRQLKLGRAERGQVQKGRAKAEIDVDYFHADSSLPRIVKGAPNYKNGSMVFLVAYSAHWAPQGGSLAARKAILPKDSVLVS
jgi:hypothetical protein